ncbi:hypothetical protein HY357_04650 [Candidatus Roizmanbacteria bacterium]|nr:hypothetical protein [Candidatus Roizmanbacteria bacterium]
MIISIVGFGYQYYLKPRIILDSSGLYSKIGRETVGSMQIANLGRNKEDDLTVRIETPIKNQTDVRILINGVPIEQEIQLQPDFTDVIIKELNPDDIAFISFIPQNKDSTDFSAFHFGKNMRTSRYEELDWSAEWWEFKTIQVVFIIFVVITGILVGYLLGKNRVHRKN